MGNIREIVMRIQNKLFFLFLLIVIASFSISCGEQKKEITVDKPVVFVSILPQKAFVDKLAGEFVDVQVMVGPGQSPATYEPTPRQMSLLDKARVYFAIGVPFEDIWVVKILETYPDVGMVLTQSDINRVPIERHTHGEEDEHHEHGTLDPHTWLNPNLVHKQIDTYVSVLSGLIPEQAEKIRANGESFKAELQSLDAYIRSGLSGIQNRSFIAFHPSWGYYTDEYNLEQIPIEKEGKEPSAKYLDEVIKIAGKKKIKTIVIQKQFSTTYARSVARAINAELIILDPLSDDYIENMKEMTDILASALKK